MPPPRICFLAVAAALSFLAAPAHAQIPDDTGAAFYQRCRAEAGKPADQCEAYLEGVADMLAAFGNGGHPAGICGSRYKKGELSRVFLSWMADQRDFWRLPKAAGAAMALRGRWPCTASQGRKL